jgi:hypothetical protein
LLKHTLKFALAAAGLSLAAACASVAQSQTAMLDPANARDALAIARKVQCSTVDGQPIVYWWHGAAYSRRQGERDVHLFNVEGMNIRACSRITDEAQGEGYALVSRELLLYKDKETGEVLSTWSNPWTGETVNVLHVANDPVNFRSFERDRNGNPQAWRGEIGGGLWWARSTFPLWYPNPLGGDFQAEVGGTYHATELFNFFGRTDDLLSRRTTTAKVTVGWSRMSDWLPWMRMNGREGMIWMHTAGRKLDSFDELSDTMKAEIAKHYPEYAETPPLDDTRPNVTSWLYYKGVAAGEIEAPNRN